MGDRPLRTPTDLASLGLSHRRNAGLERRYVPGGAGTPDLYGYGDLELAINNPGSLLAWYRFANSEGPTGDALDSSGNGRTLTYIENTAATGDGESWDSSHEAIRVADAHPEIGDGDDGSLFLQYDQAHAFHGLGGSISYPGAYFKRSDSVINHWGSGALQTVLFWVKIPSGGNHVITQTILGSMDFDEFEFGQQGWKIYYTPSTGLFGWGISPTVSGFAGNEGMVAPGAISLDEWHLVAVTVDFSTSPDTWTLWIDGEVADTVSVNQNFSGDSHHGNLSYLWVANDNGSYGSFDTGGRGDCFFYGRLDELALYSICLTQAQIQAIFAARSAGTGFGPTSTKIHLGTPATPFALSSELDDTHNVSANDVAAADGHGGTYWLNIGGLAWHVGSGDPDDSLGSDGDGYIDGDTGEVWTKAAGSWVDSGSTIVGPAGPIGATGPVPARKLVVSWGGVVPDSSGAGDIWAVPFDADGSSFTFALGFALARLEAAGADDVVLTLQKASGGNAPFATPSTVVALTVTAGDNETSDDSFGPLNVTSGDLLRLFFTNVGDAAGVEFSVELTGTE